MIAIVNTLSLCSGNYQRPVLNCILEKTKLSLTPIVNITQRCTFIKKFLTQVTDDVAQSCYQKSEDEFYISGFENYIKEFQNDEC